MKNTSKTLGDILTVKSLENLIRNLEDRLATPGLRTHPGQTFMGREQLERKIAWCAEQIIHKTGSLPA